MIPDPLVESVVPTRVRPDPTVRLLMAPVPLPSKIPVSVVDPVPPFATPSVPPNEERERQVPPTAKQPLVMLIPPVE